jgi:hypothetical protein
MDGEGDGGEGGEGEVDADDAARGVAPSDGPDGERGPDEGFEASVAAEPVTKDGEAESDENEATDEGEFEDPEASEGIVFPAGEPGLSGDELGGLMVEGAGGIGEEEGDGREEDEEGRYDREDGFFDRGWG